MKLKQPPCSASQTLTATTSQDTRLLVRETLRISANLASAPPSPAAWETVGLRPPLQEASFQEQFVDSNLRLICSEEIDGRRSNYYTSNDYGDARSNKFKIGSIRAVSLHSPQAPVDELVSFIRSYIVPEGFPDSVIPSYLPYMTWRALKLLY